MYKTCVWEEGFDGHQLAQLPFSEKLQWLEEAHLMVRQLDQSRRSASAPSSEGNPESS